MFEWLMSVINDGRTFAVFMMIITMGPVAWMMLVNPSGRELGIVDFLFGAAIAKRRARQDAAIMEELVKFRDENIAAHEAAEKERVAAEAARVEESENVVPLRKEAA
jgi:hypothetical protein